MGISRFLCCISLGLVAATTVFAQGTVILPLANVTANCLNATKKTVDFWILSARVPTDATWFKTTSGVGARVDVTLSGPGVKASFPAASTIDIQDLSGTIVRASLGLHVLADEDLWNTKDPSAQVKTTNFSVPLTFVRRQGSSDTIKVFQALLNFTESATAAVPPNPYVKGAELVGQLASSIATVFTPNPNEVVDPNFSLAFSLSRVDSDCSAKDLHDNVGVEITDSNAGDESQGIIKTDEIANYCFYKIGEDSDPNIGFVRKGANACAASAPTGTTILQNPQFIWLAYGNCKDDTSCSTTPAPSIATASILREVLQDRPEVFDLVGKRVGSGKADTLMNLLREPTPNVASLGKGKAVLNSLALCHSVGISEERCLDRKFAESKP